MPNPEFKVGDLCKDVLAHGVILLITDTTISTCNITVVSSKNPNYEIFFSYNTFKSSLERIVHV